MNFLKIIGEKSVKNRMILLLMSFICCLAFTGPALADEVQTVHTSVSKRFTTLVLPSIWQMEEKETRSISFVHLDNEDVSFTITVGKPLKNGASIENLQKQIEKFVQKKANTIPLFEKSFGLNREDFCEDSINFINFEKKFETVLIGKIIWLKVYARGKITETIIIDGIEEDTAVTPTYGFMYAAFINNSLQIVSFVAPQTSFDAYESLFNKTMQMICK